MYLCDKGMRSESLWDEHGHVEKPLEHVVLTVHAGSHKASWYIILIKLTFLSHSWISMEKTGLSVEEILSQELVRENTIIHKLNSKLNVFLGLGKLSLKGLYHKMNKVFSF